MTSGGLVQRPVQTCLLEDPSASDILLLYTETGTVGEWAVRILLVCFLIS